ncbi:MAG TPA: hypothetical protein VL147_14580 [Devosia sp.]|nr:hypothetical protein [Devosia sp.]
MRNKNSEWSAALLIAAASRGGITAGALFAIAEGRPPTDREIFGLMLALPRLRRPVVDEFCSQLASDQAHRFRHDFQGSIRD